MKMDGGELTACDVDRSRSFLHSSFDSHRRAIDALDSSLRPIIQREPQELSPYRYNEDLHPATTPAFLASIPEAAGIFIAADRACRRPRRIDHPTRAKFPGSTGELRPCCWSAHPSPLGYYPTFPLHRAISDQIQCKFELTPNFSYFDGESYDEDYLEWEQEVDDFFYYVCVPREKQVRCVVRKLKGRAKTWWTLMLQARYLEGRSEVKSWRKMKSLLRGQFLTSDYEILSNNVMLSGVAEVIEKRNNGLEAEAIHASAEIHEDPEIKLELSHIPYDENVSKGIEVKFDEIAKPRIEIPIIPNVIPPLVKVSFDMEKAPEPGIVVNEDTSVEGSYSIVVSKVATVSFEGGNIMERYTLAHKKITMKAEVVEKVLVDAIIDTMEAEDSHAQVKTIEIADEIQKMISRKLNVTPKASAVHFEVDNIFVRNEESESLKGEGEAKKSARRDGVKACNEKFHLLFIIVVRKHCWLLTFPPKPGWSYKELMIHGVILGRSENYTCCILNFSNKLIGKVSYELFSLKNLSQLLLLGNSLTGEIPRSIGNYQSLVRLRLGENQLSGEIHKEIGEISSPLWKLMNLKQFNLSRNSFTRENPSILSNFNYLYKLILNNNLPLSINESKLFVNMWNLAVEIRKLVYSSYGYIEPMTADELYRINNTEPICCPCGPICRIPSSCGNIFDTLLIGKANSAHCLRCLGDQFHILCIGKRSIEFDIHIEVRKGSSISEVVTGPKYRTVLSKVNFLRVNLVGDFVSYTSILSFEDFYLVTPRLCAAGPPENLGTNFLKWVRLERVHLHWKVLNATKLLVLVIKYTEAIQIFVQRHYGVACIIKCGIFENFLMSSSPPPRKGQSRRSNIVAKEWGRLSDYENLHGLCSSSSDSSGMPHVHHLTKKKKKRMRKFNLLS